jgi:hypothetical protein
MTSCDSSRRETIFVSYLRVTSATCELLINEVLMVMGDGFPSTEAVHVTGIHHTGTGTMEEYKAGV